jgi:RNA polymerase sigma-70 factor (ECF subfamily)
MDQSTGISTAQARELSVLWTKAYPIVSTYFRACLCDFHRSEDLLQETAAAVAESFTSYDPARPFTGWVLGIARHKLLQYYRAHAKDRHLFDDQAVRELADVCAEMEPEISAMQAALERCVDRVQGRPRKLLEMRYVRELTPRAIAEKTGMNANAVSVMLHRARKALRDCIARQMASQSGARPT